MAEGVGRLFSSAVTENEGAGIDYSTRLYYTAVDVRHHPERNLLLLLLLRHLCPFRRVVAKLTGF